MCLLLGRIALEIFKKVNQLHCFDISQEMLKQSRKRLEQVMKQQSDSPEDKVKFHLVHAGSEISLDRASGLALENSFDFIYS